MIGNDLESYRNLDDSQITFIVLDNGRNTDYSYDLAYIIYVERGLSAYNKGINNLNSSNFIADNPEYKSYTQSGGKIVPSKMVDLDKFRFKITLKKNEYHLYKIEEELDKREIQYLKSTVNLLMKEYRFRAIHKNEVISILGKNRSYGYYQNKRVQQDSKTFKYNHFLIRTLLIILLIGSIGILFGLFVVAIKGTDFSQFPTGR